MLFEVSDPNDTDGFFLEMSSAVKVSCPELSVVPFCFGADDREAETQASNSVESFRLVDVRKLLLDRVTVEAGTAFRKSPQYESIRFLGLKLLNRMDFSGTFRFLEREILFQQGVMFAIQSLIRLRPSLLVFRVTPHEFLPFLLWRVADFLGVEVLHFQPCSVAPVVFPIFSSGTEANFNRVVFRGTETGDFLESCAKRTLNSLSKKNPPGYMTAQIARDKSSSGSITRLRGLRHSVKWLFSERFPSGIDFSGHGKQSTFLARLTKLLLTRSLALTLKSEILSRRGNQSSKAPFALFALHYEPERTSIPDGLPIDHQTDAVMETRAFLPPHLRLLVKEHYSQQSTALRGFLGRSPSFYEFIERFPNTDFAPFGADSVQLVQNAECVVTLTGTVGIEAVLGGVPVVYYGSPWWAGVPGSARKSELQNYGDVSNIQIPHSDTVMAFLVERVLDEGLPGLGSEPVHVIEERFGTLPKDFQKIEASALAQLICGFAFPR